MGVSFGSTSAAGVVDSSGSFLQMVDQLSRKLAAILYADVADYSRLTGDDEDTAHRQLSEYLDLLSDSIDQHKGKVVHYAGDALLAKFGASDRHSASGKKSQKTRRRKH